MQPSSHDGVISGGIVKDKGLAQSIPCGSDPNSSNASIQLVKKGDVIEAILIQCRCGEVIHVECNYG